MRVRLDHLNISHTRAGLNEQLHCGFGTCGNSTSSGTQFKEMAKACIQARNLEESKTTEVDRIDNVQ